MNENLQARIGIAERERAFELLKKHLAADRIAFAEFDERSARVQAATTQSQIDAVFADLPPLPDGSRRWRRYAAPAAFAGAVLLVVVAIAIVMVDRSHPQATRTVIVTSVIAPVAIPTVTSTVESTTPSATTSGSTTTTTSAVSGTAFPGVLYMMDSKKLDGATYDHFDTGPAEVSGTTFTRSVMIDPYGHQLAFVEYDLGRKYIHLDATLGVRDDATPSGMSMQFQIYADGALVSDTPVKLGDTRPIHLNFDHPLRLRLQVTNLNPGGDAYAVFGDLHTSAN